MTVTYRKAGVNLEIAEEVSRHLKVTLGTGLFGGFLPVSSLKEYDSPVLVSSIDGIGTKVALAARLDQLEGLGRDIVHHCVNDILVHAAKPLFFLDYLAFNRLDLSVAQRVVGSISEACRALSIRLCGGETAEMPLVYTPDQFDVAGAVVGVVEERDILDGSSVRDGDVVIGWPSSGLHTNGYSLVQQLFDDHDYGVWHEDLDATLGEALLTPHRSYASAIESLLRTGTLHALAHITGGGIEGNLSRVIPVGLYAALTPPPAPPLFQLIQERGVAPDEMWRVFNMGIGMVAVCDPAVLNQLPPHAPASHSVARYAGMKSLNGAGRKVVDETTERSAFTNEVMVLGSIKPSSTQEQERRVMLHANA